MIRVPPRTEFLLNAQCPCACLTDEETEAAELLAQSPRAANREPGHLCCFSKVQIKCLCVWKGQGGWGEGAGGPRGGELGAVVRADLKEPGGGGQRGLWILLWVGQKPLEGF